MSAVDSMKANITKLRIVVASVGSIFFKPSFAIIVMIAAVTAASKAYKIHIVE